MLNIGKIEKERGVTSAMPTLSFFNLESTVKGDEQRVISSYYKEWLSLQKKIKNQDEEKKGKNIDGEVEK